MYLNLSSIKITDFCKKTQTQMAIREVKQSRNAIFWRFISASGGTLSLVHVYDTDN